MSQFCPSHSCGVERHQNYAMKRDNGGVDQKSDFAWTQHFRQTFLSFWIWSVRGVPGPVQSLDEEEPQSGQVLIHGVGGQFSVGEQVSLEYPDVLQTQLVWGTVEMQSEFFNSSDIALARRFGIVPSHQLFDHHRS